MPSVFSRAHRGEKKADSCFTVTRNDGNVVNYILLEGPHSVDGADSCIHGNETHEGLVKKKQNPCRFTVLFPYYKCNAYSL